ncbi:MAG: dihydropteroate synthase [Peptococcaceae bacterium]|jgi:dihydropteroate synthase|nr:dihydropteroate synthase [Peptococcaceae bacterium]
MDIGVWGINTGSLRESAEQIASVGATAAGVRIMAPKAVHRLVRLSGVNPRQANIIKQEMLAQGGDAALHRGVLDASVEHSDILLMATRRQYELFCAKLKMQPFGLPVLAGRIRDVLDNMEEAGPWRLSCRGRELVLGGRTLVMGILNVTPDSFSDGGRFADPGRALEHALAMVEDGADLIDLGGESTRPGHQPVDAAEEIRRVIPVLARLVEKVPVPVSVDTSKAAVAREALEAGAHIINDQWALIRDGEMAAVAAAYNVPVVLMHNRSGTEYRDLMGDIVDFFRVSMTAGVAAGVNPDQMVLDPGFGFGKTPAQNLAVLRRLKDLACLGRPVLVGTSRKSMIGKTLDLPPDQRVEGTAATVALAIAAGAAVVRVHDVRQMVRVARMTDAVVRAGGG